jgi:hypothetical protein
MCAYNIGDHVDTPDGCGVVVETMDSDGDYRVELPVLSEPVYYKESQLEACQASCDDEDDDDWLDEDFDDWDEDETAICAKHHERQEIQSSFEAEGDQLSLFLRGNTDGKR